MNLNTVAKANMPVILGEHEMWVGVMLSPCFRDTYKISR